MKNETDPKGVEYWDAMSQMWFSKGWTAKKSRG